MKGIARKLFPQPWQFGRWVPSYLDALAERRTGNQVIAGPFSGCNLSQPTARTVFTAKLVGQYEKELHGFVEELIAWGPDTVIDVGAAEGYYAAGLALRLPQSRIVAFEAEAEGRKRLSATVSLNRLSSRVDIRGYCTLQALATVMEAPGKIAVVMDCEGGEIHLLDPTQIPRLSESMILVETHDCFAEGAAETLRKRLSSSHQVVFINQAQRRPQDYPFNTLLTSFLPNVYRMLAVFEHRQPANNWLFCKPKSRANVTNEGLGAAWTR